jgi:hypothetical protein
MVLLLEGALVSWSLAMDERGGHEDLRGSGRWSVIPYVHGRIELYCSSLPCLSLSFSQPLGSGVHPSLLWLKVRWFTMSHQGPTGGPGVGEPYTVGHNG